MAKFGCIFLPMDEIVQIGIAANSVIKSFVSENGDLIIRKLKDGGDIEDAERIFAGAGKEE